MACQDELFCDLKKEFNNLKMLLNALNDSKINESVTKVDLIMNQINQGNDDGTVEMKNNYNTHDECKNRTENSSDNQHQSDTARPAIRELFDELTALRGEMNKQRKESQNKMTRMIEKHKLETNRLENSIDYWKSRYFQRSEELRAVNSNHHLRERSAHPDIVNYRSLKQYQRTTRTTGTSSRLNLPPRIVLRQSRSNIRADLPVRTGIRSIMGINSNLNKNDNINCNIFTNDIRRHIARRNRIPWRLHQVHQDSRRNGIPLIIMKHDEDTKNDEHEQASFYHNGIKIERNDVISLVKQYNDERIYVLKKYFCQDVVNITMQYCQNNDIASDNNDNNNDNNKNKNNNFKASAIHDQALMYYVKKKKMIEYKSKKFAKVSKKHDQRLLMRKKNANYNYKRRNTQQKYCFSNKQRNKRINQPKCRKMRRSM